MKTIEQELYKPEKKEQRIELDEEEKNPYETLLIQDIREEEFNQVTCKWRNGQHVVM